MLSFMRFSSGSASRPTVPSIAMSDKLDSNWVLPPETLGAVFEHLTLRELLPCRHVSQHFKQLVDTEAKLRMVDFVTDPDHTLVMQAGPPALFDVCEYLPLRLSHFGGQPAYLTSPPLLANMSVSHQMDNPCHSTSMGADDQQYFQNLVVSVTRMNCKREKEQAGSFSRSFKMQLTLGGWNTWEITRENDRIWRHWWDDAPSSSYLAGSAASNDSGFADLSTPEEEEDQAKACKPLKQALEIGQTVNRGTLDLSKSDENGLVHEYRWDSVDLDVFRVIIAKEDREVRSGLRAILGRTMLVL